MKSVTVISGKGGTGKTTLVASLAALAEGAVLADCDVEAPDLHLLLHPTIRYREFFQGGKLAVIDKDRCEECGVCAEACRFDAIDPEMLTVRSIECEGCGVCVIACPTQAIQLIPRNSGEWFVSDTAYGPMVHARLGIGQGNSGLLVSLVRREAERVASENGLDWVLIDGPPGIGCPVISSITGTDLILAVTEPTLSGMHDLERILRLAQHFKVPAAAVINKFDLNPEKSQAIESLCADRGVPVLARIPYEQTVIQALVQGTPVIRQLPDSQVARAIESVHRKIDEWLRDSVTASKH